jgi:hypothetical protein
MRCVYSRQRTFHEKNENLSIGCSEHCTHCTKSKNNMPHENASCEAGPGTSSRKCSMTPIYFALSLNFKTDEYCRELHLEEVSGIHLPTLKVSGSNPDGDRNKKISAVVKED